MRTKSFLKIAFLAQEFWEEPDKNATLDLIHSIQALGHKIVIFSQCSHLKETGLQVIDSLEFWLYPKPTSRLSLSLLRDKLAERSYGHPHVISNTLHLRNFIEKKGPFDLLWAHSDLLDGLVAALATRSGMNLPPVVVQVRRLHYKYHQNEVHFEEHTALRESFAHATRIIVPSQLVAEKLNIHYSPESGSPLTPKTSIVYPNLSSVELEETESFSEKSNAPELSRLLYLGGIHEMKGCLTFLDSLFHVYLFPDTTVLLEGNKTCLDPNFEKEWRLSLDQTQNNLSKVATNFKIILLGEITPNRLVEEILNASLVIVPSHFDGYSLNVIKAMTLDRPVITTDTVGNSHLVNPEFLPPASLPLNKGIRCSVYIGPNFAPGIIVYARDPVMLGQAIEVVLHNQSRYLENARVEGKKIRKMLSPSTVAEKMVEQFQLALKIQKQE